MDPAVVSLLLLAVVVGLFVWNRLPVAMVAIFTSLTLWATGLLSLGDALGGFGDPVVIFIACLFVVSEGIDAAGVTTWAGQVLLAKVGDRPRAVLAAVMLLSAVVSALITLNGAAAALIPMVVVVAARIGVDASRMLMPMVFAGAAGSLIVLTASPVNVLVSDASRDAGADGFAFFSFAIVGLPLLVGTMLICLVLAPRVVPARTSGVVPPDLSRYACTIADHYDLRDGFYRLRVREGSPLVGAAADQIELTSYPGTAVIGLQSASGSTDVLERPLAVDDIIVVSGPPEEVSDLALRALLAVAMPPLTGGDGSLINREMGIVECIVPPRSPLIDEVVFPGMLRGPELVILAVRRLGRDRGQVPTALAEGDAVLVHGSWSGVEALADHGDVLVVNSPDLVRRQAVPLGAKAIPAIGVLLGMIILLALGVVPAAVAGLLAAVAMVLFRVVGTEQAYRSVSWETVVLIGGMIPLSTAIRDTGAADQVADSLIGAIGVDQPLLLLVALFLLTAILGQFVSNTATVLILLPVVVATASEADVSVQPYLMMLAVAGGASFLTPVSTPANMMIMGPAGYRFGDYWRLGLPIMGYWLLVALVLVPLVWPF